MVNTSSLASTPFTYVRKLRSSETLVDLLFLGAYQVDQRRLVNQLAATGRRFGFRMRMVEEEDLSRRPSGLRVHHLLCLCATAFDPALVQRLGNALDRYTSISIAFSYPSQRSALEAAALIERAKARYEDRINFIRPDVQDDRGVFVSERKLLENAVADSVRVKYLADRVSEYVDPTLLDDALPFFLGASDIFRNWQLFHRSSTDGFFALRAGNGFLITATKSDKANVDRHRLVLVHEYQASENRMIFSGRGLPSSDSVEAAILFQGLPDIEAVIHTHASFLFTRNERFRERIAVGRLPYGEPSVAHQICEALKESEDGFLVMDDHGEFFTGLRRDLLGIWKAFVIAAITGTPLPDVHD